MSIVWKLTGSRCFEGRIQRCGWKAVDGRVWQLAQQEDERSGGAFNNTPSHTHIHTVLPLCVRWNDSFPQHCGSLLGSWPTARGVPATLWWQSKQIDSSQWPCLPPPPPLHTRTHIHTLTQYRQSVRFLNCKLCTLSPWEGAEILNPIFWRRFSFPALPSLRLFRLPHVSVSSVCMWACLSTCVPCVCAVNSVNCVCVPTCLFRSLLWNKLHSGWGAKWLISGTQIKIQLQQFEATQE